MFLCRTRRNKCSEALISYQIYLLLCSSFCVLYTLSAMSKLCTLYSEMIDVADKIFFSVSTI
jgi:hypothetical protein